MLEMDFVTNKLKFSYQYCKSIPDLQLLEN